MPIKPIDLQTNINQMGEVGKNEHTRIHSLTDQQVMLDKQAAEKSNLINSKLDESEKAEKTSIMDEDKKKDRHLTGNQGESEKKEKDQPRGRMKDDKMGNIIDVLK
jgi:hypothetical protein